MIGQPAPAELDDILILTRHYAPEPTGSAPVMQQIAEWLASERFKVRVVTVRPNYPADRVFDGYADGEHDRVTEAGVSIIRLKTRPIRGSGLLGRLGPEARFMMDLGLTRLLGGVAPSDCVISLCPSILTTLAASLFVRPSGRHLAIVHDIQSGLGGALGSRALRLIMPILRRLERFALNRAGHVIVLSEEMREALVTVGVRRPITILPPSIDTRAIVPQPRDVDAPPTLLYSGNLGRKQGLEQLLDLAQVLRTRGSPGRIVIRGDGAMRKELINEAGLRGLDNVTFLTLAPKADLAKALGDADFHLVPQLADGGRDRAGQGLRRQGERASCLAVIIFYYHRLWEIYTCRAFL